jgi:hypothetical protein
MYVYELLLILFCTIVVLMIRWIDYHGFFWLYQTTVKESQARAKKWWRKQAWIGFSDLRMSEINKYLELWSVRTDVVEEDRFLEQQESLLDKCSKAWVDKVLAD